jgi:NAD+ synthase
MLRIALAQINPHVGNLYYNQQLIIDAWRNAENKNADLVLFPELVTTGYMPEDLLLKPSFIKSVDNTVEQLIATSHAFRSAALITTPHFCLQTQTLFNAVHLIQNGKILATRYKHHLPNYGVFDEKRYFTSGDMPAPIEFQNHKLGVMICEDMWSHDVTDHLASQGAEIFIALNASPFSQYKDEWRKQHAVRHAQTHHKPFIYLNQIGGQDDLVFDGYSFITNKDGNIIHQCTRFESDISVVEFHNGMITGDLKQTPQTTDSEIFYGAAVLATRDYLSKNNIKQVLLGLSGGIDSAIVATIAVDAIGYENVTGIMMPSPFTSQASLNDAKQMAKNLRIDYKMIPINGFMTEMEKSLPSLNGLAHENMQSRARGNILMTLSNQSGALVLTTGNKSEIAMGYATLYGDMCGGFNPIIDLYKTQVYLMAQWRNENILSYFKSQSKNIIPDSIITKPPTAELRDNQTDQDSLPPYDILDGILNGLVEKDLSVADVVAQGYDHATVQKVQKLLYFAEYKRKQAAIGPKMTTKAFTRERRYPIVNGYKDE